MTCSAKVYGRSVKERSSSTQGNAYIVTVSSIEIEWLAHVEVRVCNDARIVKLIGSVGVGQKSMSDEDITGFGFNLGELTAVFDVVV